MPDAIIQFSDAIKAAGLTPPDNLQADGKLRRFSSNGKRGDDAGWYVFYVDGVPAGSFGDWRTGFAQTWRADIGRKLTDAEIRANRERMEVIKRQREAEEIKGHEDAATKAAGILKQAQPAPPDFPYLTKKGIQPNGAKIHNGLLVLPMRDTSGKLWNIERISPDGSDKKGLYQGKRTGCYFSIGSIENAPCLCIAEGFATGASIHEATGFPVAVVFNAGNLVPVAKAMRDKFPDLPLVLCADDDYLTEGNPGLTKATEAARLVGGVLALPDFGANRPEKATDFNDMHQHCGLEAVASAIANASESPKGEPQPGKENAPAGDCESQKSDEDVIAWLAGMKLLEYERIRVEQAKLMKCRPSVLDDLVKSARNEESEAENLPFPEIEPHPEPIDQAQLLNEIADTIKRFIVLDKEQADAAALWVAFTWFIDVVEVAPLAIINAPEKACGKSQLLDLLGRMAARPLPASNSTAAGLFRAVELWKPTVLIDEADTFIKENDELKGLINAGHTRSNAFVLRVVGDNHEPKLFKVWGAKALAGIALEKHLPDATISRAIVFELRRKLPHESVARLRHTESDLFESITSKLARFADDYAQQVRRARPDLPDALGDRAQDNWEPLLAIAGCAGADWIRRATTAALKLSGAGDKAISTADLIAALVEDDEKSWSTYNRGKPISARQIANRLAGYGIKSKTIRLGYETAKGFESSQFDDAFARYLSDPLNLPSQGNKSLEANNGAVFDVTHTENVTVTQNQKETLKPAPVLDCDGVTDKSWGAGNQLSKPSHLRI